VTEYLRPPGFANQVIVLQDASMGFKLRACLQREDKMFMPQADQLGKITVLCNGRGRSE
jgi:hypothetical protein